MASHRGREVIGQIKNWGDFQHYKNRSPPWIKLQKSLLDDFDFACLPVASKALAPLLWLLASESMDGTVRIDREWLAFRLRFAESDIEAGLTPLIEKGFLIVASGVLAPCLHDACLEGEGEGETEGEEKPTPVRKPKKPKAVEQTFVQWAESLDGLALLPDDPIYAWAESVGLPADWIGIAWWLFEDRYAEGIKTYADWRAVFRKACREDWLKVWRHDSRDNRFLLTTAGTMAQREMAA